MQEIAKSRQVKELDVRAYEGKNKLSSYVSNLVKQDGFYDKVRRLIVARDADDSAERAFQSVIDVLRKNDLSAPEMPGVFTNATPSVCVLILPGGDREGCLESLLAESVSNSPLMECVDEFLDCIEAKAGAPSPQLLAKRQVYSFISAQNEPDKLSGQAFLAGYFNIDHKCFRPINQVLDKISDRGANDFG